MAETMADATAHDVAETVRQYLHNRRVGSITLEVMEDKIRRIDGWWKVPIRPSAWPERMSPLYEELAAIEDEMRENAHLDILLSAGEPVNVG